MDRIAAGGVFLLALAIRLAHFMEIRAHDPFFELPSVDPRIYHQWALRILGGDLLGTGPFILGPLYPYFLALVYKAAGPSIPLVKLLQCVLGSLLCVFVYYLGTRLFSRAAGLVAGIAAACCSMLVFYGGTLMIVNLLAPLVLLLLIAAYRAVDSPGGATFSIAGALLGLCVLARENSLLIGPPLLAWMMLRTPIGTFHARVRLGAFFSLAVAAVIMPATLRNLVVTGEPILVNAAGGMSFYTGNNPDADGTFHVPAIFERTFADDPLEQYETYSALADRLTGRRLGPSELTRFWVSEGFRFIREKPGRWAALELRKLDLFFNAAEVWNNRPVTLAKEFSAVLRLPLLTFGVMLPLALVGFFAALGRWRELAPLHIVIGVHLL